MERLRWASRTVFLFAAVGSAVGLGNVWRFPYLAGKYGGGAFLIPYVLMLFVLGVPLLMLELALGQKMQRGAIGAFRDVNSKLAGVGVVAILCGFTVAAYYAAVMAWSLLYVSYSSTLKWGQDTASFFYDDVLHLSQGAGEMGGLVITVLVALIVVWSAVYFCIWKGVRSVSKVVMVTVPLPVILIVILVLRGLTLPNAMDGLVFYLKPDFAALLDLEVWTAATSQIFFTLSLAFGIMVTYASFKNEDADVTKNAFITAITNSSISIVAGVAIFSTLGFMAAEQGVAVSELAASGPSLAFIVYPEALSLIPLAPLFAVLFFVAFLTLAIDSEFSLVEAVTTAFGDRYGEAKRETLALITCVIILIPGLLFATNGGLYYLDITDHYITNYGLVLAGLLECLAIGWVFGAEELRLYANQVSDWKVGKYWTYMVKYVIPVLLVYLLIGQLVKDIRTPYEGYPQWAQFAFGWVILIVIVAIGVVVSLVARDTKGDQGQKGPIQ